MALIDELKLRHDMKRAELKELVEREEEIGNQLLDLDIAIAALEPPAQPVHPDELRTVPGAVEEAGTNSDDWQPTLTDAEITVADLEKLATKATDEERAGLEIPEGYRPWDEYRSQSRGTKVNFWNGSEVVTHVSGEDDVPRGFDIVAFEIVERKTEPRLVPSSANDTPTDWTPFSSIEPNAPKEYAGFTLETAYHDNVGEWVFRYRIISTPAEPEQQFAGVPAWANDLWRDDEKLRDFITNESAIFHDGKPLNYAPDTYVDVYFDGDLLRSRLVGDFDWDGFECAYFVHGRSAATPAEIEQEADIQYLNKPTTDLWQQGYDDRKNGFDPSLAEPDYLKGYEARETVEREQSAVSEQAKFFDGGMMADADRHQSDPRGIVGVLTGIFKREREDA